jgi:DNA-binding CsgD family transcriptional regulator
MLRPLILKRLDLDYHGYVPHLVQPLLDAASKGEDLVPVVEAVTKSFGFDAFNCAVAISLRPDGETLSYVFTTMPAEWVAIYDQRSYIEVDPRVQTLLLNALLPVIWDQDSLRGKSAKVDEFLVTGLRYGLGSGVAVGFVDLKGHPVMVALNSKAEKLDPERKAAIFNSVGDITLFGHFFYEMFVARIVAESIPPRSQGAPLSPRERECLSMAAHGLTGNDIARQLGITARTVQFHFGSICSKLAAVSRQEAVAKAVQAGLVTRVI